MGSSVSGIQGIAASPTVQVKQIAVGAQNVQVTLTSLPDEPMPSWHITAVVGGTRIDHRHTIGATSGQIGSYTQASLQAEIDAVRLAVATMAANIESVRVMGGSLT
jgi:hypothetical protein